MITKVSPIVDNQPDDDYLTEFFGGNIISKCTRADLIESGDLVDVTTVAKEAGIKLPVALTSAVFIDCVKWEDADNKRKSTAQDQDGRLWDLLNMLAWALRNAQANKSVSDTLAFQLRRVPREGKGKRPMIVTLKAVVHPGDAGERVLTVLDADEAGD